jgi:hypothetical protein
VPGTTLCGSLAFFRCAVRACVVGSPDALLVVSVAASSRAAVGVRGADAGVDVVSAVKYRKKPVVVEAEHLSSLNGERITDWINANGGTARLRVIEWAYDGDTDTRRPYDGDNPFWIEIETLEGTMAANIGDWVIRGVAGEFYPCRDDIFAETYERAADA